MFALLIQGSMSLCDLMSIIVLFIQFYTQYNYTSTDPIHLCASVLGASPSSGLRQPHFIWGLHSRICHLRLKKSRMSRFTTPPLRNVSYTTAPLQKSTMSMLSCLCPTPLPPYTAVPPLVGVFRHITFIRPLRYHTPVKTLNHKHP